MSKRAVAFRLEDVLSAFRGIEVNDDALVALGDDAAMRVAVAWSHTDQSWSRPSRPAPPPMAGKMAKLWEWIVSGWDVDARTVARLAGVPATVAHAKLEMLIGNRLLYPDGSMAKGMRAVLMSHAAKKLGLRAPLPPPPKPAAPPKEDSGN